MHKVAFEISEKALDNGVEICVTLKSRSAAKLDFWQSKAVIDLINKFLDDIKEIGRNGIE